MIDYEDTDWEARHELWEKYYEPELDYRGDRKESPIRGVSICHRCGALVENAWKHLDWHEKLELGKEWQR